MAYNDYGAFVYLNGTRQHDYEDVPLFGDKDTDLGPGARIYASLIRQYGDNEDGSKVPFKWPSRCHHGTIGNGKVRVGVYKTGIAAASIYVLKDDADISDNTVLYEGEDGKDGAGSPFEIAIDWGTEIVKMAGQNVVPFPKGYDGSDEHQRQADEYSRQMYGPYRYEFDVAGHHLLFEAKPYDEIILPNYHARMECPNGDVWDVFYDSCYGAGISDCVFNRRDDKFEHIDVDEIGNGGFDAWPVSPRLPVSVLSKVSSSGIVAEQAVSVTDDALNRLAKALRIEREVPSDGDGGCDRRILYRAMNDESGEREPVSTISGWASSHYIDAESLVRIVQFGIELGRMGVDAIGSEHWWPHSTGESVSYGLDGTVFDGLSSDLTGEWMVPVEVRHDRGRSLHESNDSPSDLIDEVFESYRTKCEEADWERIIDENGAGVQIAWPIRDANGLPFSPLMQKQGDGYEWDVVRRLDDGEECQVTGCGWNDEQPFVILSDGEFERPDNLAIVCDEDEDEDEDLE